MTAVQMLRKESDSTYSIERDNSPTRHNEAEQYEAKLIQVADMHAELMEFNARLTLQLANRYELYRQESIMTFILMFSCCLLIVFII